MLLLAAIVAVLAAFVVIRLRADLTANIDRSLSEDATQIAHGYAVEGIKDFRDVTATVLSGTDSGAQILDDRGRVVAAEGGAVATRPMLAADAAASVRRRGRSWFTSRLRSPTEDYRLLALPVMRRGRQYVLVAGASLDRVQDATDHVVALVLLGGPAALLLTAAGGWWLARKALRPVGQMAAKAERIEIDRLQERIAVPKARDELSHLASTLNTMLDRLSRGVEARQRLVGDASHELRSPLAVMRSEIDVTLDDPDLTVSAAREALGSVRQEVDGLAGIVDGLLTLAGLDERGAALRREPVELHDLAQRVVRRFGPLARAKGVRLSLEGPPAMTTADPDHVGRALANLIDNAIKVAPSGSQIAVASWHGGREVGLTVTDAGPGIPVEARERIFERFARLDAGRSRRHGGSGLGLAICRELIEAHGGRVWVSSEGRGSAFSIALPADTPPRHGSEPIAPAAEIDRDRPPASADTANCSDVPGPVAADGA